MSSKRVGDNLVGRDPPVAGLGRHASSDVIGDLHVKVGHGRESTVTRLLA